MLETKHFERLADSFENQATEYQKIAVTAEKNEDKIEALARANQLLNCMKQLLQVCIKVGKK